MRVLHKPTKDEVSARRRYRYLEEWPVNKQLEAYSEAAAGRPEKLEAMKEDFAKIREVLPYYEEAKE